MIEDRPSYRVIRHQLREQRGPASEQPCQHCGRPADHWTYDRTDPGEYAVDDRGRLVIVSADLSRYVALCIRCRAGRMCPRCGASDWGSGSRGGYRYRFCRPCRASRRAS